MSAIDAYSQSETTPGNTHTASEEARAALWAGILGAAKHIGKREPLQAPRRPLVVQLRAGQSSTPVYFIGAGLFEFHLAQLMSPEQSLHAVEIAWPATWHDAAIKNNVADCPTLEQLVAPYVAAIRDHSGSSPCVLIGYSFNGNIAFEAAHQLQAQGTAVETVMLLDAPAEYPSWYRAARKSLREIWRSGSPSQASQSLAKRLLNSWSVASWSLFTAGGLAKLAFLLAVMGDAGKLTTKLDTLGRPLHWGLIERLYDRSLRDYRLRRLDARGVLFRADRAEDCPTPVPDPALGWSELFEGGLGIVQISGGHKTMIQQSPHDLRLASEMTHVLGESYARLIKAGSNNAA